MKAWLKGGLIGLGMLVFLNLILMSLVLFDGNLEGDEFGFALIGFGFLFIPAAIIGFTIGAIIGLIIGKLKSGNKK